MAVGASVTLANAWLNTLRNTAYSVTTVYAQLHTANPGTAGTTSVSSTTTRQTATFSAASAGAMALSNTPSWTSWAGTNGEVVTHVSFWDASTAGNFLWSAAFAASKTMNTGDTLNLTSATVTFTTAS